MLHHRQRLALSFEAGDDLPGVHAQLDDFERNAAANRFFLFRHIDDAAPAFADLLEEFVVADAVAGFFYDGSHVPGGSGVGHFKPESHQALRAGPIGGQRRAALRTNSGLWHGCYQSRFGPKGEADLLP